MEKALFFDREGNPIDFKEHAELHLDKDYVVVDKTSLLSGVYISTVWVGIDLMASDEHGKPFIFETMAFLPGRSTDICRRYISYGDALAGHKEVVAQYKKDFFKTLFKSLQSLYEQVTSRFHK